MEKKPVRSSDSIDTSNGTSFDNDVLMDILSRLPAKSLFRFKCVSKAWCNLISSDYFQRKLQWTLSGLFYRICIVNPEDGHSQLTEQKYAPVSGGRTRYSSVLDMTLSFLPYHNSLRVIDSCNGLLLCLNGESRYLSYCVCNPFTMGYVALPKPQKIVPLDKARLAFDPQVSPHYKVICLWDKSAWSPTRHVMLEIYSSDVSKWVESRVLLEPITRSLQAQGAIYLYGTLHVLASPHHIVGINPNGESCQTINLPGNMHCPGLLGECKGSLCYASLDSSSLQVWMLESYDTNEWILKYSTSIQALEDKLSQPVFSLTECLYPSQLHLLAFHPSFEVVYLGSHCKLCSFYLASSRLEEICSVTCERDHRNHFFRQKSFWTLPFKPCVNSLAKGGSEALVSGILVR